MLDTQFFEDEVFEDKSEIESSERKKIMPRGERNELFEIQNILYDEILKYGDRLDGFYKSLTDKKETKA